MIDRWHVTAVLIFVCVLGLGVGVGCGSETELVVENGVQTSSFLSRPWGFGFRYPVRCITSQPRLDQTRDPGLLFSVLVADPEGAVVGGKALDVFAVSVHRLTESAHPGDVGRHRGDFERIGNQLLGRPERLRYVESWKLGEFAGQEALVVEYVFSIDGQPVVTRGYLVARADRVYWITAQASRESASGSDMGVTLDSFTFE